MTILRLVVAAGKCDNDTTTYIKAAVLKCFPIFCMDLETYEPIHELTGHADLKRRPGKRLTFIHIYR